MNDGGINKSNALLVSAALGMVTFGALILIFELDIPGPYILGFSFFTFLLSISDLGKASLFKATFFIASVPCSIFIVVLLSEIKHDEFALARMNNFFTIVSMALVLMAIVLGEKNSKNK